MNKYVFHARINKKGSSYFCEREVKYIVETDLILDDMEYFDNSFPEAILFIISGLGIELRELEYVSAYKTEKYKELPFRKIVFGNEKKKIRIPEKYDVFQVTATEFLICCFEYQYIFNKKNNTIKKMKMNYPNPEDSFVKVVRENFIPIDVKYFE